MGWGYPPEEDEPETLVRPNVAAQHLGVCTETVRRWMRAGHLPYERIGPHKLQRIRLSDVMALRTYERSTRNDK